MQIFEFRFNPKEKPDLVFDSFCFEPKNVYEKRLGSLFLVAELKNALPLNYSLLEDLAQFLRKNFYSSPIRFSPETALKENLKKINGFLEDLIKEGNTSWLGNLGVAVLLLKKFELHFTKVGNIKIVLIRGGQAIDIDQKLKFQEIEPYPLKVFGNIVFTKLLNDDLLLILTEEVWGVFEKLDLLEELTKIERFDQRSLKEIFERKKEEFLEISGLCLLISLVKKETPKRSLYFKKDLKKQFSFKRFLKSLSKKIESPKILKINKKLLKPLRKTAFLNKLFKKFPKIKISFKGFGKPFKKIFPFLASKNFLKVIIFIVFIGIGFLIFNAEKEKEVQLAKEALSKIKEEESLAQNLLDSDQKREANILLQKTLNEILPYTKIGSPIRKEAIELREIIEEKLFAVNRFVRVSQPNLVFEINFQELGFKPQKILFLNKSFYFFNPQSVFLKETDSPLFKSPRPLKLGTVFSNSLLFFSEPNYLISFSPQKESNRFQEIIIKTPDFGFEPVEIFTFAQNIYLLDGPRGEILKYSFPSGKFSLWLDSSTQKTLPVKSFAIDGDIWILTKDNQIFRYYQGKYQEALDVFIWPPVKNLTKIFTSPQLPYLYLLEPEQKRIIVLSKKGEVVKQFQSEKFDQLLDFTVSPDGKIYLLNNSKLYQLPPLP